MFVLFLGEDRCARTKTIASTLKRGARSDLFSIEYHRLDQREAGASRYRSHHRRRRLHLNRCSARCRVPLIDGSLLTYRHMSASACCRCTCVRWLAICCCWCASVCFMSTILMLCSIAYFLARATASACSEDSRGSDPPRIAGSVEHFAPGPEGTRTSARADSTLAREEPLRRTLTGIHVARLPHGVHGRGRRDRAPCKRARVSEDTRTRRGGRMHAHSRTHLALRARPAPPLSAHRCDVTDHRRETVSRGIQLTCINKEK